MFDISFFRTTSEIKKKIVDMKSHIRQAEVSAILRKHTDEYPCVFNIETTNACNMKCKMCPRTSLMRRPAQVMKMGLFEKVIKQIMPHKKEAMDSFWKFIADEYRIHPSDKSENAFYFYTVSKSLILHGYGEPPLDPYLVERIALCSKYNIPTYFSCVPANIDVDKFIKMMEAGVGVIKFAMDAIDDESAKKIRGKSNDFTRSYKLIRELINAKSKNPSLKTKIVITMLDLSRSKNSVKMHDDFMGLWKDRDVYAYIKSQDNQWYYKDDDAGKPRSHYETQYCEFPWTSMTVMVDGSVVPCTQDYNCEMVLGNANSQTLKEIWNSVDYKNFRRWHINGDFPKDHKCYTRCDQKLICKRLKKEINNERFPQYEG
ncbi:MAG: SPASM domain-containing protein [Candidatus Omnitrophota bacterium]|nr:SPASM domain-containing protein [Candidatus Omnitrophota bacterium]